VAYGRRRRREQGQNYYETKSSNGQFEGIHAKPRESEEGEICSIMEAFPTLGCFATTRADFYWSFGDPATANASNALIFHGSTHKPARITACGLASLGNL
jgi:hypothetical protein